MNPLQKLALHLTEGVRERAEEWIAAQAAMTDAEYLQDLRDSVARIDAREALLQERGWTMPKSLKRLNDRVRAHTIVRIRWMVEEGLTKQQVWDRCREMNNIKRGISPN